jgi:methylphosphotriester-DNA--protein-cysteine methyltransferase
MILLAQGESVTDTASLRLEHNQRVIDSFRRAIGQTPGAYRDLAAR